MSRMWWYTSGTLVIWVLNPEFRRVYDLFFGYSAVEPLALLPILSLIPFVWSLTYGGGWRRLPPVLKLAASLWLGAFTASLITACIAGNLFSGIFEYMTFVLPIGVGLWIAADDAPFDLAYRRVTRVLFGLATIAGVYGIIQYVSPPIWDVVWLKSVIKIGLTVMGQPLPFQIRVFSVLNDSGSLALFFGAVMLLALPELSIRKPLLLLQIPFWIITFGLSLVRTGWIMFAIGLIVYIVLSPRRLTIMSTIGVTTMLVTALVVILPAAVGNDAMLNSLTVRFNTLQNLDDDTSGKERAKLYVSGPEIILSSPLGQGLGVLGQSAKLGDAGATADFDSGFLGRSLEMGIIGAFVYLLTQIVLANGAFRVWSRAGRRDPQLQCVAASAVSLTFAYAFVQLAHDFNGFPVVLYWLGNCLVIKNLLPERQKAANVAFA
jgi:O-antigen ligase